MVGSKKYGRLKFMIILLLLFSLAWFIFQCDWNAITEGLSHFGYRFIGVIFISFVAYFFGSLAWFYCFNKKHKKPGILTLFNVRLIGENVSIINPTNLVGGESSKVYLLTKLGIPLDQGLSSILLSRVIMMVTHISLFIVVALIFMLSIDRIESVLIIVILLSIGILLSLYFLLRFRKTLKLQGIFKRFHKANFYRFNRKYVETKKLLTSYYSENKKGLMLAMVFSLLHWIIGALELWIIFQSFGVEVNLLEVVLMDSGIILLKSFAAFIPAQIGVEEYANKVMFSIVGISSLTIWITASILRRARQLFWLIVSLALYLFFTRSITNHSKRMNYGSSVHHT